MKKLIDIPLLAVLTIFSACEKETENISFETHYAVFEMTGENPYILPAGTAYADPGIKATAGEKELEVTMSDDIDETEPGVYTVIYSATNADGFDATTSRTVLVYDPQAPDTDLSGTYTSAVVRTEADGSTPRSYENLEIALAKAAPGIFMVTDFLGGYYAQGTAYGPAYAMTGYFALNTDHTLTLLSSHVSAWGDGLETFHNGSYNPANQSVTWKAVYADADIFTVTLKMTAE